MEYLYLTKEQNQALINISKDSGSQFKLVASPYEEGYILNSEVLSEPLYGYYMPLLTSLTKIDI